MSLNRLVERFLEGLVLRTCDFCEHDRGPLAKEKPHCESCIKHSNFELKSKMPLRMSAEWSRHQEGGKPYHLLGYDKDYDGYVKLVTVHSTASLAIGVADHISHLKLRRNSNNEPFDWIEVVSAGSQEAIYIAPCK